MSWQRMTRPECLKVSDKQEMKIFLTKSTVISWLEIYQPKHAMLFFYCKPPTEEKQWTRNFGVHRKYSFVNCDPHSNIWCLMFDRGNLVTPAISQWIHLLVRWQETGAVCFSSFIKLSDWQAEDGWWTSKASLNYSYV